MCAKTRGPTKHPGYGKKGNGYPNDHVILYVRRHFRFDDVIGFREDLLEKKLSKSERSRY